MVLSSVFRVRARRMWVQGKDGCEKEGKRKRREENKRGRREKTKGRGENGEKGEREAGAMAEQGSTGWSLSASERAFCAQSLADSLSSIRFHLLRSAKLRQRAAGGVDVGEMNAEDELELFRNVAAAIEEEAHNAAGVMVTTTTGQRPHEEGVQAYARKCSDALLELIKNPELIQERAGSSLSADGVDMQIDLSAGNRREFLTADSARKALEAMFSKCNEIRKVVLSTKSFGVEAAEIAREAFEECSNTLDILDASDAVAGRPEEEQLKALQIMCAGIAKTKISKLDLSHNALGEKGVRACVEALKMPSLNYLALENDGISVHAAKALDEIIGENAISLRGLRLWNNMSDDEGAFAISNIVGRARDLEEFRMASSRVKEEGCKALCSVLKKCEKLKCIDLSDNPFGEDIAGPAIAACIEGKVLRKFVLNDMCLGDENASLIINNLTASCQTLEELELSGNELTVRTSKLVVAVILARCSSLSKLSLADNELKDRGAMILAQSLPSSLKVLDLSSSEIGSNGALAIANAIKDFPNLESVNLNGNFISEESVETLETLLGKKLGNLEDNDPEGFEEDEDDDDYDEGAEEADMDDISQMMSRQKL